MGVACACVRREVIFHREDNLTDKYRLDFAQTGPRASDIHHWGERDSGESEMEDGLTSSTHQSEIEAKSSDE